MSTKRDARETVDLLLDMLLDALEERQSERDPEVTPNGKLEVVALTEPLLEIKQTESVEPEPELEPELLVEKAVEPATKIDAIEPIDEDAFEASAEIPSLDDPIEDEPVIELLGSAEIAEPEILPDPLPTTGMDRTVKRMFVGIIFFVILANIPINYAQLNKWLGTSAANGIQTVRVAREGMLVREVNKRQVFIMENNKRRWITTPEAFDDFGYRWSAVREVSTGFVDEFDEGDPYYLLLKCPTSPHIYALDVRNPGLNIRIKRWIKDVPTLNSMKHQWQTIENVDCNWLRRLPQGEPFPADAGTPPQP